MDRDMLLLEWIAADWGSSQLRLWALDAEDRLLAQQSAGQCLPDPLELTDMNRDVLSAWLVADWALDAEDRLLAQQNLPQGMARLTPDQFEPTVLTGQALVDLGMVGRGGLGVTG